MNKEKASEIKPKRAKTPNTDHKQPEIDNLVDNKAIIAEDSNAVKSLKEKIAKLWLHGLTNKEIIGITGLSAHTVSAYVVRVRKEFESMPADMLKSKVANVLLKYLFDSDAILRRYSIELTRLENDKDLEGFVQAARAMENQIKTLTDCLVRMGVVQTPVKGKGTQYPQSPNNNDLENLSQVQEKDELIAYHERRLRALKRKKTKEND